jgi:hypothetical protein
VSFVSWICIHLLLRPAVEARGEGVLTAIWDVELVDDGVFLLQLQEQQRWILDDH